MHHHIWLTQNHLNNDTRKLLFKRPLPEYLRNNSYVTTSGNFCTPALHNCMAVMGVERILVSTNYSFETVEGAAT